MSVASVAQLLLEQGGGGGGLVDDITAGDGIDVNEISTGVFEISNIGVVSITAGDGINVDASTGDINISNTGVLTIAEGAGITITETSAGNFDIASDVNPADYYTITDANATFQTLADTANYSTTVEANALYQSQANMVNYSTTAEANALYQSQADMVNYSTTATANTLYFPLGNINFYLGLADLSAMAPQSSKGSQIVVPFFSRSTSAILISSNEGAGVASVVCNVFWASSILNPPSTTLELSFFNSSTTVTVNTGMYYSILVINV